MRPYKRCPMRSRSPGRLRRDRSFNRSEAHHRDKLKTASGHLTRTHSLRVGLIRSVYSECPLPLAPKLKPSANPSLPLSAISDGLNALFHIISAKNGPGSQNELSEFVFCSGLLRIMSMGASTFSLREENRCKNHRYRSMKPCSC